MGLIPLLISIAFDCLLGVAPPTWPLEQIRMAMAISAQEAAFFLLTWGVLRQGGQSLRAVGLGWHRPWLDVLWGVGLGVVCFAISPLSEYVSRVLFTLFIDENTVMQMLSRENMLASNLILVSQSRLLHFCLGGLVIVVAPVAEETFFRGYAYSLFKERWGTTTALFVNGLLFAAVHAYVIYFPSVFLLGFLLGLAYEWRKNLLTPIVAHGVMNLLVAVTVYCSYL